MKQKGRKMRIPRTPNSEVTHVFSRSVSQSIPVNQFAGFLSSGFALGSSVSLAQMVITINGASVYTVVVPGYLDFTALFDQYQIRSVTYDLFWSKNISGETSPGLAIPLLWSAMDYDDIGNFTLTELQQYPGVTTTMMGEDGGKVFHRTFRPVPRLNVPDGAGGTGFAPTLDRNVWIDCTYPQVSHNGIKIYLDTFGRTANSDIGSIMVCARIEYAFKHPR